MTLAGLLQSKLVSMDMLSPQPSQELLPPGSEMQVATVALLFGTQRLSTVTASLSSHKNM